MSLLAITPYAGSKKLVAMTQAMLESFKVCAMGHDFTLVAVNNAADDKLPKGLVDFHYFNDKNEGFGNAINLAVRRELYDAPKVSKKPHGYSHVLILNNDLQFPHISWFNELLIESDNKHVASPCTDVTATRIAVADGPDDENAVMADQVSAFCWLVPVPVIELIRKRFGFDLFHPEFSNYGSDDITGAVLRKIIGPKPFKVVRRSWVKHLKAQTANELGVKAGTAELLLRIRNFKRARRLA